MNERAKRVEIVLRKRLLCTPTDGNAWLRLAMIRTYLKTSSPQEIDALVKNSYLFAPAEKWIMVVRSLFQSERLEAGETRLFSELNADLEGLTYYAGIREFSDFFVIASAKTRSMLMPIIAEQKDYRRRMILQTLDTLGVSFRNIKAD